jgi:hypothetical protein
MGSSGGILATLGCEDMDVEIHGRMAVSLEEGCR